jgi:hypothetical protein
MPGITIDKTYINPWDSSGVKGGIPSEKSKKFSQTFCK